MIERSILASLLTQVLHEHLVDMSAKSIDLIVEDQIDAIAEQITVYDNDDYEDDSPVDDYLEMTDED